MEENNKDMAISFLKLASGGKVREAFSKFVGTAFKHHNPFFEGSAESLMAGMEENARLNPNKVLDVKHAISDGGPRGDPFSRPAEPRRSWRGCCTYLPL